MSQPHAPAITPNDFDTFGELVRYLRERAELSQRELAAQVGYHFTYLSRVERNERTPEATTLMARFIPALGLEDQPQWTARLLKLAARNTRADAPPTSPTPKPDSTTQAFEAWPGVYPVSLTPLLGRAAESEALQARLVNPAIRLITVVGPPGVGKTRLAIEVAGQVSGMFADGVLYLPLAPVTEVSGFLKALAQEMGVQESAEAPLRNRLAQALRHKNLLLFFDNFEQLVSAAPEIVFLLGNAPQVKALVTSREPLHLAGENEFPLKPLEVPDLQSAIPLDLLQYPVIQLFHQRAQAVQPDFQLTAENSPAVIEICRGLDGLPLAIELAAARVKTLPPQTMLKQLDRPFDWLASNRREPHTWRQTLQGALDWSHTLLTEKEQILFRRLSVFSYSRTLEAVEAICADDDAAAPEPFLRQNEILDLLLQLVDKSLRVSEQIAGETRFYFLETVHEFARTKLEEAGEATGRKNRHLAYFCQLAERAEYELERVQQVEWADRCEAEINNFRAALDWSWKPGADFQTGARLAASLSTFWVVHTHYQEGLKRSLAFLQKRSSLPEEVTAKLLFRTADLHRCLAEYSQALELGTQSVQICRKLGNQTMLAVALHTLGETYYWMNDIKNAQSLLQEAVELCQQINYPEERSLSLILLGKILHWQGDHLAARATLQEGLDIAERLSDRWGIAYGMQGLGSMYRQAGKFEEARASYRRSLEAARQIGDKRLAGDALASLALLTNLQGQYPESDRFASEALTAFQSSGDEERQPFPLRMMGYAAIHAGNFVRARVLIGESLKRNFGHGHFAGQLACLVALAECYLLERKVDKAVILCAAIEPRLGVNNVRLLEPDGAALQRVLKQARKKLGNAAFDQAHAEGQNFAAEELIAELLHSGIQ